MVGCRCLQSVYINRTTDSRSTADACAVSYMTDKDEAHQFPIQFAGPVFRTLYLLLSCKMRLTRSSVLRESRNIPLTKSFLACALFDVVTLRCMVSLTNAIVVLQRVTIIVSFFNNRISD